MFQNVSVCVSPALRNVLSSFLFSGSKKQSVVYVESETFKIFVRNLKYSCWCNLMEKIIYTYFWYSFEKLIEYLYIIIILYYFCFRFCWILILIFMKMKSVEIYLLQDIIFNEKNVLSGLKTIRNFIYCVTRDFKGILFTVCFFGVKLLK